MIYEKYLNIPFPRELTSVLITRKVVLALRNIWKSNDNLIIPKLMSVFSFGIKIINMVYYKTSESAVDSRDSMRNLKKDTKLGEKHDVRYLSHDVSEIVF